MIDIGVNLINVAFAADREAVLERAWASGVQGLIVTGTDVAASRAAVQCCAADPARLWCTVGVHPHDAARVADDWCEQIEQLASAACVRAIGETGLDYNRNYSPPADQLRVFRTQLELAARLGLPVFVHDRDSAGGVAQELRASRDALRDVVVHCFTGSDAELDAYLALDCHIGITGWICDERRGATLVAMVGRIPQDRLLLETDAPYLLPRNIAPRPRSRRNEPAHLLWIARSVAAARNSSLEDVIHHTTLNARRVFALD